jgi:hypothetical protein
MIQRGSTAGDALTINGSILKATTKTKVVGNNTTTFPKELWVVVQCSIIQH